jgi:hypothetical protein
LQSQNREEAFEVHIMLLLLTQHAGQALLENILPQHVAESLVKREAKKRSRVELHPLHLSHSCAFDDQQCSSGSPVQDAPISCPWLENISSGSTIVSQQVAHAQQAPATGAVRSTIDAMIAYKQWHPAVSILFAVSALHAAFLDFVVV